MDIHSFRRAQIHRSYTVVAALTLTLVVLSLPGDVDATLRRPSQKPVGSSDGLAAISSDCSDDVTASVQTFLDSIPDGTPTAASVITFPSSACYRIEGTLHLTGRSYMRLEGGTFQAYDLGPNGVLDETSRNRSHWRVESSTGITFAGTSVEGPIAEPTFSDETEAQHGFVVNGASQAVTLTGVRVTNVLGDFVAVSKNSSDVEVVNGDFAGSGRQGFSVNQATDVVFRDNRLSRVNRSAVDIEPLQDWEVHRISIINNTFTAPIGNSIIANAGTGGSVTDITISDNVVVGAPFSAKVSAPCGGRRSGYIITNNVADELADQALSFKRIDDLTITGNTFPTEPERQVKGGTRGGVWIVLTDVGETDIWANEVGSAEMEINPNDC